MCNTNGVKYYIPTTSIQGKGINTYGRGGELLFQSGLYKTLDEEEFQELGSHLFSM